ncbi:MAG: T9SS type A sorting domain-containing protein [Bacteroidetes bacterium]|nr:MAG: T9SS type A sorting domain-containing protein [Bacteroidota bacterium]
MMRGPRGNIYKVHRGSFFLSCLRCRSQIMKRITLPILFMLLAGMAVAQIPNGNIESWKTFGFGPMTFDYPEGFLTSNFTVFQGSDPSVTEVTGVNGGKAAQIKTHLADEDGSLVPTSGLMMSLKGQLSLTGDFDNKFAISGKPSKFEGYYSFAPVQGDTFSIVVLLYQNGTVVGVAEMSDNQTVSNLSSFSLDIDYVGSNDMPDSASITILSSSNEDIHDGTTLTVDELKFVTSGGGTTAIFSDAKTFNGQVYPVPANNTLNIRLAETSAQSAQIELFDISGKLLMTKKLDAYTENASLDISGLPSGILFGTITVNGQKHSFKASKN